MILSEINKLPVPKRIVSLVPSQTELLYYLGLNNSIVGITKFCVHPEKHHLTKTIIGGTKNINLTKINSLQPDLIIANKEENVKEQINQLAENFDILVTDVNNFETALSMIKNIGQLTNKVEECANLIKTIKYNFNQIPILSIKINTAYFIWKKPYMTIGGDTFINDMLTRCGLRNIFIHKKRYPEVSINDLKNLNCQLLLLSTEPYPFKQNDIDELQLLLPKTIILLVDGEMFSWYGSRLLLSSNYFKNLLFDVGKLMDLSTVLPVK